MKTIQAAGVLLAGSCFRDALCLFLLGEKVQAESSNDSSSHVLAAGSEQLGELVALCIDRLLALGQSVFTFARFRCILHSPALTSLQKCTRSACGWSGQS